MLQALEGQECNDNVCRRHWQQKKPHTLFCADCYLLPKECFSVTPRSDWELRPQQAWEGGGVKRQVKTAMLILCTDPGASSLAAGELELEAGQAALTSSKMSTTRRHRASEQKCLTLGEATDSHWALLVFDVKPTELHN